MSKIALSAFAAAFLGLAGAVCEIALARRRTDLFHRATNGAVIDGKVIVKFGLSGTDASKANIGHRHLLIDVDPPSGAKLNQPMPHDYFPYAASRRRPGRNRTRPAAWQAQPATHYRRFDNVAGRSAAHVAENRIEVKAPPQP